MQFPPYGFYHLLFFIGNSPHGSALTFHSQNTVFHEGLQLIWESTTGICSPSADYPVPILLKDTAFIRIFVFLQCGPFPVSLHQGSLSSSLQCGSLSGFLSQTVSPSVLSRIAGSQPASSPQPMGNVCTGVCLKLFPHYLACLHGLLTFKKKKKSSTPKTNKKGGLKRISPCFKQVYSQRH